MSNNNITESSVDENDNDNEDDNESSFFKLPLKERLKKRSVKIGNSPLPSESLNYGPNAKRDGLDDLSDLDLSFEDKEK